MKLTCFVSKDVDLYFIGRVLAGLYAQPETDLRIELADCLEDRFSLGIEIEGKTKLGINLSDHREFYDHALFRWCDVYAKRSLSAGDLATEPKVIPYGLHCAGYSSRSATSLLKALMTAGPRHLLNRRQDVRRYLSSPYWSAFESAPPIQKLPLQQLNILFQTRVWSPSEAPGEEIVNAQRVELVRAIRKEFGVRFSGGLIPSAFAREHYPDLISQNPTRQLDYIQWAKAPAIGIYSRGLFDSIAFKMAEYVASSKCIVSEPIQNVLPKTLESGLWFHSNDECIHHCQSLLSRPELVWEYQNEAWKYYCSQARPAALIANLLDRAISLSRAVA